MAAAGSTEAGAAPAAIGSMSGFVVEPALIDGQPLEQKSGALAHRLGLVFGEFFEKIGVAKQRVWRFRCPKFPIEQKLILHRPETIQGTSVTGAP
jgi:hypothetical protein